MFEIRYRCELCKEIVDEMICVRFESAFEDRREDIHFCQECFEAIRVKNVSIGIVKAPVETCPT